MILVNSCLAGMPVRYNGTSCGLSAIQSLIQTKKAVPVCPKLLGGFTTPREPAEIVGGSGEDVLDGTASVIEKSGRDVTSLYIKGAYQTLKIVKELNATVVVLKESSPSCGSSMIYNGAFQGTQVVGMGVTTALLRRHSIEVFSEEEYKVLLGTSSS
ncbi:DUF523 domain-containing protein [Priestia flexa]|uniref:DUF523 domain-containing protein n=1 Tax=Priestia flexa TaxID=86664 RepID=A0ABU4J5J1_9BACI|nr:DUF523 domain-containing protein [Priestia flexa]MCP1189502.1 DUF523 domain-containing protein [Priestia flexa]MDW8516266.1 DUF523 domain-containing protein [Priestia flexa]